MGRSKSIGAGGLVIIFTSTSTQIPNQKAAKKKKNRHQREQHSKQPTIRQEKLWKVKRKVVFPDPIFITSGICIISGSRKCILGQGKLVTVLVQLTLCKIIKQDFNIYFRQSFWEMPRLPRVSCPNFTSVRHDSYFGKTFFTQNSFQNIPRLRFWWVIITTLSIDATIMVSKNCPITGEHVGIMFVTQ